VSRATVLEADLFVGSLADLPRSAFELLLNSRPRTATSSA